MGVKESVKNIMQTVVKLTCLVLYCGQTKHNSVLEAYLSTSKSIPLPLTQNSTTKLSDDEY